jgi:transketolase N-terminal domain/subunit
MAMRLDEAVVITDTELMGGYRRLGPHLQDHLSAVLPWVDVACGSLGQGSATVAASRSPESSSTSPLSRAGVVR